MVTLALVVSGCARPLPERPAAASQASRCATSIIGTAGPDPFVETVLRREGARNPHAQGRLPHLAVTLVTACGTPEPGSTLSVDACELRRIDGMQACFGREEAAGETILLGLGGKRPPNPLDDVPNDHHRSVRREATVAGLWMAGVFAVRSPGILPAP